MNRYRTYTIKYIAFALRYPHFAILIPVVAAFLVSYNVLYDFTIKKLNARLSTWVGGFDVLSPFNVPSTVSLLLVASLAHLQHAPATQLSKVVLSSLTADANTLTYDFFLQLYQLEANVTASFPSLALVSPFSNWPVLLLPTSISDPDTTSFNFFLIKYLNYDLHHLATFLFLDKIVKSNHLIKFALNLKFYVVHDQTLNISSILSESLHNYPKLHLESVVSTTNPASVADFIRYYFVINKAVFSTWLFVSISNVLEFAAIIAFVIYMYISIANEHKIRSSLGLLIGWLVSVLISCGAAVNTIKTIHGYKSWRLMLEPSTAFTKASFVLTIMFLSSRGLFTIVNTLSDSESPSERHKRLYKLYSGFHGFPLVLKNFILGIFGIVFAQLVGTVILHYYIGGYISGYIFQRMVVLGESLLLSMVIQFLLQLTYLVGIIILDLRKVDVTRFLDHHSLDQETETKSVELEGVNFVSFYLLKFDQHSSLRPERSSFRYKLGQFFLKIRNSEESNSYELFVTAMTVLQLLAVFIHWVMTIPLKLLDDSEDLVTFGRLNILRNSNNYMYYLELLSIVIFVVAIASIVFRLNYSIHGLPQGTSSVSLNEEDFVPELKTFNSIELTTDIQHGHSLDVIKCITNSKTSFVVSIGLDHKVLIWSPLINPNVRRPINIATTITKDDKTKKEFWPINHLNISDDGNFTVLINYRHGVVKCFERLKMTYIWESRLPAEMVRLIKDKKFKILESFFRRRTVPGFLARRILQNKKNERLVGGHSRQLSDASVATINPKLNSNFPAPPITMKANSQQKREEGAGNIESLVKQDDFVFVLESGELVSMSCSDGSIKSINILDSVYRESTGLRLVSVKKVTTPRVNDRIVCQVDNLDLVVATVINNQWKSRILPVKEDSYNQPQLLSPVPLTPSTSERNKDFRAVYNAPKGPEIIGPSTKMLANKAIIVPVDFVGMIIRVNNFLAELIDLQRGIVLKTFNVGHFKSLSFKVSHLEPTHCKFCGCASIQSFSIVYEDYDSATLIMHTFKIDIKRSKNNICLRVERDPREIRCLGFNAVTEHQHWFNDIEAWELTDVNLIMGLRKKNFKDVHGYEDEEMIEEIGPKRKNLNALINNSGLASLRNRRRSVSKPKTHHELQTLDKIWEGFIVTAHDGKLMNYQLPNRDKQKELVGDRINCISKYGYKAIVVSASNIIEILYLGNDQLIEEDLYFSGTNATIWSVLEGDQGDKGQYMDQERENVVRQNQTINSELLFINKRRKARERHLAANI